MDAQSWEGLPESDPEEEDSEFCAYIAAKAEKFLESTCEGMPDVAEIHEAQGSDTEPNRRGQD
jgi:hypothetical protein